jgi:choline dehydrogenase-like flavoprotein
MDAERGTGRRVVVVGSGPAGIACTQALVRRGHHVVVIDGGLDLEEERRSRVAEAAHVDPESWSAETIRGLRGAMEADFRGVPLKLAYGSDFPYRDVERMLPMRAADGAYLRSSLAVGGFSNVWGASMLPVLDADIADWPIRVADLAPHYREVLRFVPLAGRVDALERLLPLHAEELRDIRPSRQAEAFLHDAARHAPVLAARGITVGQSRLAMTGGCRYVGLCMEGCPWHAVYGTRATLGALVATGVVTHEPGWVVDRVAPREGGVTVLARQRDGAARRTFDAEVVFIAAGAVASTRIALASLGRFDHEVVLRDSQYFLVPLLRYVATPGVQAERLHTLAQAFVELRNAALSAYTVHLQIYGFNELFSVALRARLGRAHRLLRGVEGQLLGRLLVAQGYLHSRESSSVGLTLRRHAVDADVLDTRLIPNHAVRRRVRRVVRELARRRSALRLVPLLPMLTIADVGRGFHSGGTFPMAARPDALETDVLGRLAALPGVHLVDASVLPSIPATTVTLTVMANAHRIGSQAVF